jgi:hypothetical protein
LLLISKWNTEEFSRHRNGAQFGIDENHEALRETVVSTTTARSMHHQNTRRDTAGLQRSRSIHNDDKSSQGCWILCIIVASLKALPGFDSRYKQKCSLLHSVQTDSRVHPASYTMATGTSVSGVKRKGSKANHEHQTSAEIKKGGAISPLPRMSSWHSPSLIKQRVNFTVSFTDQYS